MTANGYAYTAEELRELAPHRLLPEPPILGSGKPWTRSDFDLNPGTTTDYAEAVKLAAVLVAIRDLGEEATIILTERTHTMPTHAGQIAFPGGRLALPSEPPREAALREAEEEIGLGRSDVSVIGYLDSYRTRTGYHIAPVVAVVANDFTPVIDEREVASVFEVPLAFLMDPAHHLTHSREWRGEQRRFYAMPWGERYIWGATAGMLKNLYDRVYGS